MLLHLWIVLAGEITEPPADVTADDCNNEEGVCQACIKKNIRYPYWNGDKCVSCSVGYSYDYPYLNTDHSQCTYGCYRAIPDDDNVCQPCPAEKPYSKSGFCQSCEDAYLGMRNFWSPMFADCVESCPKELAPTDGSMTCKTCEGSTPYWGIYEQKCVTCT